ncbi:pyridoxal biosynthesis protein [Musa troglodytarum]|uniref:glutaminase n=1 Tax=Musa troglodytarum TaxID=320322 RepID=A0A9E7GU47_9LILI|nr:pyridoxal biosynthesis protein [Musa troglodytarum]
MSSKGGQERFLALPMTTRSCFSDRRIHDAHVTGPAESPPSPSITSSASSFVVSCSCFVKERAFPFIDVLSDDPAMTARPFYGNIPEMLRVLGYNNTSSTSLIAVMTTVGVLALQGSFNEHMAALRRIGVKGVEIRKAEQLQAVDALIIPGGESTTMAKLAHCHNLVRPLLSVDYHLFCIMVAIVLEIGLGESDGFELSDGLGFPALREFVSTGKPVWGTCAGLIFLANKAIGQKSGGQELIGGLDCIVNRNFFGSQLQSFETELSVPKLAEEEGGPNGFRGVFIRAPAILEVGPDVEILADCPVPLETKKSIMSVDNGQEEEMLVSCERVIVAVRQGNLLGTAFHPELTSDLRWHSFFLKMKKDSSDRSLQCVPTSGTDLEDSRGKRHFNLPIYE